MAETRVRSCVPILILIVASLGAHAGEVRTSSVDQTPSFGTHRGYLFDVEEERTKRDVEMVMLSASPDPLPATTTVIVNEKLTKEFQSQYQYRFGQTATEQAINSPSRSDGYSFYTGETLTITRYREEQKRFGEYMARRLTEFHVDNWAKNDPSFRPVYELKDKVSNVNVNVASYKVKWKYNFSGPNMDLVVENPYKIDFKVRAEMTGVVSAPAETIFTVGYPVTSRVYVQGLQKIDDGLTQLMVSRQMTRRVSCSLTGSTDKRVQGPTVKQDLVLVGLSWSD